MAEWLAQIGFNVLSLANNHILDHGAEAADETMKILRNNEIEYVGLTSVLSHDHLPLTLMHDDVRIAFLAYSLAR